MRNDRISAYQSTLFELNRLSKHNEPTSNAAEHLNLSRRLAKLAFLQDENPVHNDANAFSHQAQSRYVDHLLNPHTSSILSEISRVLVTKEKERGIKSYISSFDGAGISIEDLNDTEVYLGTLGDEISAWSDMDKENQVDMDLDDNLSDIQKQIDEFKENQSPSQLEKKRIISRETCVKQPQEVASFHLEQKKIQSDLRPSFGTTNSNSSPYSGTIMAPRVDNTHNNSDFNHCHPQSSIHHHQHNAGLTHAAFETNSAPKSDSMALNRGQLDIPHPQSDPGDQPHLRTRIYGAQRDANIHPWNQQSRQRDVSSIQYEPQYKKLKGLPSSYDKNRQKEEDDEPEDEGPSMRMGDFQSARDKLVKDAQKNGRPLMNTSNQASTMSDGPKRKQLGTMKRAKFVPPLLSNKNNQQQDNSPKHTEKKEEEEIDPRLKHFEPKMIETIMSEVMDHAPTVAWDDIAGLEHAKNAIKEIVVWPMLRPDIFTGIRGPPKGLLLFGPPGTGKTLIGKCIASQCQATFFSISSSSLTSKWVGDGEKMVRALFAVARIHQPSVIFVDEIDSLLTQRTDGEQEATRRIKTEFLVQFDGCGTNSEDRILMIGATNRPHEIDEAARRRFRKKLYIPLPEAGARRKIVENLLSKQVHDLSDKELDHIVQVTDGYSGSDMNGLVCEAALGPIRDIKDISTIAASDVRPINANDFRKALTQVRASVSIKDLDLYLKFDKEYGSIGH